MTTRVVYLVKPHSRVKKAHELQIEYEDGKKKTFVGTQIRKTFQEVDQLLEQKETQNGQD